MAQSCVEAKWWESKAEDKLVLLALNYHGQLACRSSGRWTCNKKICMHSYVVILIFRTQWRAQSLDPQTDSWTQSTSRVEAHRVEATTWKICPPPSIKAPKPASTSPMYKTHIQSTYGKHFKIVFTFLI